MTLAQYSAEDMLGSDTLKIYNRKRNAHACIMSIVFIVLLPLGAISLHLPIKLKIRIIPFIHAPIQLLALAMMIGGMGLGINLAKDLDYFNNLQHHVVIGLITVNTIILVQPAMGILQHRYYKRTGGKSIFAYLHRWIGRAMILLGIINSGLGFQLAGIGTIVPHHSLVRNCTLIGVLSAIWFALVAFDEIRGRMRKRKSVSEGEKAPLEKAESASSGNAIGEGVTSTA